MDQDELRGMLQELFDEHKGRDASYSLAKFGADIAKMIGRAEPYKKQYIAAVLKGQRGYPVSGELAEGLRRLALVADGVEDFQVKLMPVPNNVLSMHPLHDGSIIMGASMLCATPGCGMWFVPSHPSRRYCPKCRPPRIRHMTGA